MKKRLIAALLLVAMLMTMLAACGGLRSDSAQKEEQPYLRVDFVDVGQADFILVECDGVYMTIDGGNTADSMIIYSLLLIITMILSTNPAFNEWKNKLSLKKLFSAKNKKEESEA